MSTLNVKDSSGNWKEIPSIGGYTKDEVNEMLGGKANAEHAHSISEVSGLQNNLNSMQSSISSTMKTFTTLLDTRSSGTSGTVTLNDSVANYRYVMIFVQFGTTQSLCPAIYPGSYLSSIVSLVSQRVVLATDTQYLAIYFPSATSMTVYGSSYTSANIKMLVLGVN